MLSPEEIKTLIASGEGYQAEWKKSIPSKAKDITEEVCAFANAAGGVVLIGVDDEDNIIGAKFPNDKRSTLQNSINEIDPSITVTMSEVVIDGKNIIVIDVPSGKRKPYMYSGAIYMRQGPNTQKLTSAEQVRDFFQQSDRIFFDELAVPGFNIETDLEEAFFKLFRTESGFPSSIENNQIIKNLKLLDDENHFKAGSVLFFGKSPESHFEKAVIRCVAFEGIDKRTIIDSKDFTGPLYYQYRSSMQWLKGKLDVRYDIEGEGGGPRKEIWEIPETAFKEAIINALAHRDYYDKGARITVEVFKDRVEISNPGGLISGIKRSEFGTRSLSRNPLIFGLFERMDLVEQIGSGISRIRELMADADLPNPVFQLEGMFTVILRRPVDFSQWINQWHDELSSNRIKILEELYKNNTISKEELGEAVGLSKTAIDNNIKWLRNNDFLNRIGSDRGGKWQVLFKNKMGR